MTVRACYALLSLTLMKRSSLHGAKSGHSSVPLTYFVMSLMTDSGIAMGNSKSMSKSSPSKSRSKGMALISLVLKS